MDVAVVVSWLHGDLVAFLDAESALCYLEDLGLRCYEGGWARQEEDIECGCYWDLLVLPVRSGCCIDSI